MGFAAYVERTYLKRRPASELVICPNCGHGTDAASGKCTNCWTVLTSFEPGRVQRAHDQRPAKVHYLRGLHPARNGCPDRSRMWYRIIRSRFDLSRIRNAIDVGCGMNWLMERIHADYPNVECVGYDVACERPGAQGGVIELDLEQGKLPLADKSVDFVSCSHALEHVDNAHGVLDDMLRVGRNVFVALPNDLMLGTLIKSAFFEGPPIMHGMPLARPTDRHRWVFSPGQAERLMRHLAGRSGMSLEVFYLSDPRLPAAAGRLNRNLFVGETAFLLTEPAKTH